MQVITPKLKPVAAEPQTVQIKSFRILFDDFFNEGTRSDKAGHLRRDGDRLRSISMNGLLFPFFDFEKKMLHCFWTLESTCFVQASVAVGCNERHLFVLCWSILGKWKINSSKNVFKSFECFSKSNFQLIFSTIFRLISIGWWILVYVVEEIANVKLVLLADLILFELFSLNRSIDETRKKCFSKIYSLFSLVLLLLTVKQMMKNHFYSLRNKQLTVLLYKIKN